MILFKRNASIKWKTANLLFLTFLTLSAVVDCGGGWLRSQAPWPSPRRTDGTLPRSASLSPRMPGLSRRPSRLVCLHHPRHPPTPPAPGAVCEARRGGRALHDGPAAVGRWCWRGQCTWCVCAGARRAVVVAVLRAAGGGSCAAVRRDGVSPGGYRHCHTRRAMRQPPAGPLHRDEPPATPHASVRSLPAAACTRRSRVIEEPGAPSPAGCSSSGHRH